MCCFKNKRKIRRALELISMIAGLAATIMMWQELKATSKEDSEE